MLHVLTFMVVAFSSVTGLAAQAPSFKTGVSRHFFD